MQHQTVAPVILLSTIFTTFKEKHLMARTPSNMIDIGTIAPDFNLTEPLTGKHIALSNFTNKPLLVVFSCNHCPYVLHILNEFVRYADDMMPQGLSIVMINANDVANYVDDSPEKMIELIQKYTFKFPYLYDESQAIAKAYQAACTPDFFLFDAQHTLVYRGQFDSSRPRNNDPITGKDLRAATEALLKGRPINKQQTPSLGCNIKWKAGNAPDYFNS